MQSPVPNSPLTFTPKRMILEMLDADPAMMAVGRRLIAAGEVFGFSENQVRVALSRLLADGLLTQPCRGEYALHGTATGIQQEARRWQQLEQRLKPWAGNWCGVLVDNLAAEGSTQFRTQSRALAMRGMQRWRAGLWVRPNNLLGGAKQLGEELMSLGLDAMRGQCAIEPGDTECEDSLRALWNNAELEAAYRQNIAQLGRAGKRLGRPQFPSVLVETIELGSHCIKALLTDPLLPDELANGDSRRQLTQLLQDYDRKGRQQWQQFIQQL